MQYKKNDNHTQIYICKTSIYVIKNINPHAIFYKINK